MAYAGCFQGRCFTILLALDAGRDAAPALEIQRARGGGGGD